MLFCGICRFIGVLYLLKIRKYEIRGKFLFYRGPGRSYVNGRV